jgi:putative chitinase
MPVTPGFTQASLTRLCGLCHRTIRPDIATAYGAALEAARASAELTTALRVCQFIGQIATETGGFQSLVESMKYRDPARLDALFSAVHGIDDATTLIAAGEPAIANRVYANRMGNGDAASGDGWTYRGRGFIMLTGRSNYIVAGRDAGLDLVEHPDLLGQAGAAATAAMAYWRVRRINLAADTGDVRAVTRLVNAALVALASRVAWFNAAKQVWQDAPAAEG